MITLVAQGATHLLRHVSGSVLITLYVLGASGGWGIDLAEPHGTVPRRSC